MRHLGTWLIRELKEAAPAAVYFFVAFQIIAFTDALMLEEYGVRVSTFALATIGALVAAKVVLVVDLLPVANRFAHGPLIGSIAWKTILFLLLVAAFKYLEHLVPLLRQHQDVVAAHRNLYAAIEWPRLWAMTIWLIILFAVFVMVRELERVLGRGRLRRMFFASNDEAPAAGEE